MCCDVLAPYLRAFETVKVMLLTEKVYRRFIFQYKFKMQYIYIFSNLSNVFIQSKLQMRTIEAIKTNKRAIKCKCYDKFQLA